MADPRFYRRSGPIQLAKLATKIEARLLDEGAAPDVLIEDVSPFETAGSGHLTYCADRRFLDRLPQTTASACLVKAEFAPRVPQGAAALICPDPARAFAKAAALFYPPAKIRPGIDPRAIVDPSAKLGAHVHVGPGAVIEAGVEIGRGSVVGASSVIAAGTAIGTDCVIGPLVTIAFSLIGDRVLIHPGVHIGQDGFGFVAGAEGPLKIPQLGRVIIQDDVEIGAGTCIDRGAGPDTVIGQGTKIDNLVQIGHNVHIGRGCVIAAQAGISGSTVIGDFVALGGKAGLSDHLTVGSGARIAAMSGIMRDVPPGESHGGVPARPIKDFMRETAMLSKLAKKKTRDA